MCVSIDFASFYYFVIVFWDDTDGVLFWDDTDGVVFFFHCIV
jgi:hypothetical protein